jgi:hypothetical protein
MNNITRQLNKKQSVEREQKESKNKKKLKKNQNTSTNTSSSSSSSSSSSLPKRSSGPTLSSGNASVRTHAVAAPIEPPATIGLQAKLAAIANRLKKAI